MQKTSRYWYHRLRLLKQCLWISKTETYLSRLDLILMIIVTILHLILSYLTDATLLLWDTLRQNNVSKALVVIKSLATWSFHHLPSISLDLIVMFSASSQPTLRTFLRRSSTLRLRIERADTTSSLPNVTGSIFGGIVATVGAGFGTRHIPHIY